MFEVGRVCVKIAGRDARKKCVIVEVLDDKNVMIDGQTRRRKCNVKHLEPTSQNLDIKKGADRKAVTAAFKELDIELKDTKAKDKTERPRRQRKVKEQPEEAKPAVKKAPKKTPSKKEEKKE